MRGEIRRKEDRSSVIISGTRPPALTNNFAGDRSSGSPRKMRRDWSFDLRYFPTFPHYLRKRETHRQRNAGDRSKTERKEGIVPTNGDHGMSGRMLLPASSTSTCTLLCTQDILLAKTPKNKSNQLADSGATGAAAIAFAADAKDEFVDFAWLDEDGTDPAGEEDAQALDDLLRLESVFGNAEVNSTAGSSDLGSSDLGISDLGSSVGVGDDLRDEEAACCVEDLLEGDDAEGLLRLFDGDLQGA